jgi:hypothetical protein
MTTNVAHFVIALAEVLAGSNMSAVEKARKSISHIFPVIAGFALGCAAGAAGEGIWGSWSLALPTGLGLIAPVSPFASTLEVSVTLDVRKIIRSQESGISSNRSFSPRNDLKPLSNVVNS